jgi:hypothetical protein
VTGKKAVVMLKKNLTFCLPRKYKGGKKIFAGGNHIKKFTGVTQNSHTLQWDNNLLTLLFSVFIFKLLIYINQNIFT